MLIGGHVSPAGGLPNALLRGQEIGARSIQIFHQSPRAWRPTNHTPEAIQQFNEDMAGSPIDSVIIHAVYLINCASKDAELRRKSRTSLIHALQLGDAIGADGVVLHPGSTVGEPHAAAMKRASRVFREALGESGPCPLLLEDTAGAGNTLGRSFEELAGLIELTGGDERLGLCLDCCHMLASGFDIRTIAGLTSVMEDCDRIVGLDRLGALHVNDSQVPLGSNVDRHADLPHGELGERGLAAFLSEPRFEGLPAVLETKADPEQIEIAKRLRKKGLAARRRAAATKKA
ncbi:MAG: deoxyribonuclease [Thermoleophilaceae bacterium]|jgi:deoxyribonuclease-4|nr:deoxyribonuclease [Thermoleophilaceae bacterium]